MATTKLIIRENKANSQGECLIYVRYTHNEKSVLFSTGEKIPKDDWDPVNQKVKRSFRGFTGVNNAIDKIRQNIRDISTNAKARNIDPTVDYVRKQVDNAKPKKELSNDFIKLYEEFIQLRSVKLTAGTIKNHKITLLHLKDFALKTKFKLSVSGVNQKFHDRFRNFLIEEKHHSPGTIWKTMRDLRTFMNYLTENGFNSDMTYKTFRNPKNTPTFFTLTQTELNQIYTADFSHTAYLERARDLFVFLCTTGLRYSDLAQLKPQHITEDSIELTTQKTKDSLSIPLNPYSTAILLKYDMDLPVISVQKLNDFLKIVGKRCGIDKPVEVITFVGGKRISKMVPKYELLTTHMGRRSFITISLEKGVLPKELMQITGHKSLDTLLHYVNRDRDEAKDKIKSVWNTI